MLQSPQVASSLLQLTSGASTSAPRCSSHGAHQPADEDAALVIFSEVVSVHVRPAGRDEFTAALTVRLRPDNLAHPRQLLLELTDESDLLFYHSLLLGESDFHMLKAEQRLRVDFQSFPSQLVELLRRCMADASGTSSASSSLGAAAATASLQEGISRPNMLAHLDCSHNGDSVFSIVESNVFRELTHISLRLQQGSDDAVKQHLAGKLRSCRAEASDLSDRLKTAESQLEQSRRLADELTARARVVSEERTHLERSLETTHERELAELRQEHARILAEAQRAAADERSRIELDLQQKLTAATARADASEHLHEDLKQKQHALTTSERGSLERLEVAERQLRDSLQETQQLREQVKQLELLKFRHEREIGEFGVQVSGLKDQLVSKEQLLGTQSAQIEQATSQRRSLEEALETSKQQVTQLEGKFAQATQEISKGNQIIQSQHAFMKQAKAKLKLKQTEISKHEKAVCDLERAEESGKHALEEKAGEILRQKEKEAAQLQEIQALKQKLADAHEVLKSNQDAIEYLNRQLTERDLKGLPSLSSLMGSGAALGTTMGTTAGSAALGRTAGAAPSGHLAELLRKAEALGSPAALSSTAPKQLGACGSAASLGFGASSVPALAAGGYGSPASSPFPEAKLALASPPKMAGASAAPSPSLAAIGLGHGDALVRGHGAINSDLLQGAVAYRSPATAMAS